MEHIYIYIYTHVYELQWLSHSPWFHSPVQCGHVDIETHHGSFEKRGEFPWFYRGELQSFPPPFGRDATQELPDKRLSRGGGILGF